jgi:beta-lactamase regulating signal transducer with metallopeptidase domain
MRDLVDERAMGALSYLGSTALRATVLLLLALAAAVLLKLAAARHRVWSGALVALLLLPVAGGLCGRLALPILPRLVQAPAPFRRAAVIPVPAPASEPLALAPPTAATAAPPSAIAPAAASRAPWPWVALGVWCLGTALLLRRCVRARRQAARLLDGARPGQRGLWPVPAHVDLRARDDVAMPVTIGVLRPAIVVPGQVEDWPAEWRAAAVAHETAHVRRRDPLLQLLAELACALYWFHPLVWVAAWQLRVERELAADDDVLLGGVRASSYARLLLALGAPRLAPPPGALVPLLTPGGLKARLGRVLEGGPRRALGRASGVALATLGALAFVPVSTGVPVARKTPGATPALGAGDVVACASEGGRPLAGATADLWTGTAPVARVTTDASGCLRWPAGVEAVGDFVVYVRKGPIAGRMPLLLVPYGTALPLHIEARRAQAVSGVLRDDAGRPVGGATVSVVWTQLFARGPGAQPLAETASDGRFRAEGLLYGSYRLAFQAPWGVLATASVKVDESDLEDIDITVGRSWAVTGYVRDPAGHPIAGAHINEPFPNRDNVLALGGERRHIDWDESGPDGAFSMARLGRALRVTARDRDGRALLAVIADGGLRPEAASWAERVWPGRRMTSAPPVPINVVLAPATLVHGEARFADGRPMAGAIVRGMAIVYREGHSTSALRADTTAVTRADQQGHFELGPFPEGDVELTAMPPSARDSGTLERPARQRLTLAGPVAPATLIVE